MSQDPYETFFIKKGETQCMDCEAHFPKGITSHICGNFTKDHPQFDTYLLEDGRIIKRMIYKKSRRFVFLSYNNEGNLQIFSDFKIAQNHVVRSDQKKTEEG
jgi:hypothetical protein